MKTFTSQLCCVPDLNLGRGRFSPDSPGRRADHKVAVVASVVAVVRVVLLAKEDVRVGLAGAQEAQALVAAGPGMHEYTEMNTHFFSVRRVLNVYGCQRKEGTVDSSFRVNGHGCCQSLVAILYVQARVCFNRKPVRI